MVILGIHLSNLQGVNDDETRGRRTVCFSRSSQWNLFRMADNSGGKQYDDAMMMPGDSCDLFQLSDEEMEKTWKNIHWYV